MSGYEELAEPTDAGDITGSSLYSAQQQETTNAHHRRTKSNEENANGEEEMTVESLSLADISTPKARNHQKTKSKQFETPYEKIQHQIRQQYRLDSSDVSISHPTMLDRYSAATESESGRSETSSPFFAPSTPSETPRAKVPFINPPSTVKRNTSPSKRPGPLLHRVLDNNWRLQATPLSKRNIYADVDALSSPPPPEMTTQIFSPSPMAKLLKTPLTQRKTAAFEDSDDDFEEELGMSPPVTMQFSMPASKLLKTPARTAAMNIVEEVLRTAGARDTSLESIKTPGRRNVSDRDMWNAFRSAGTENSSSRRKVDVDLDGSPFVSKSGDVDVVGTIGGVADRSLTMMTTGGHQRRGSDEYHTAQSLGDWQESEDWLN